MTWEGCDIAASKAGNSVDLSQVGGPNSSAEECCWTRCQTYNATGPGTTAGKYVCTSFQQPGDWACWYHDASALGPTAPFTGASPSAASTIHIMAHGPSYVSQLGKADCFLDATMQSQSKAHTLVAENCPILAVSTAKNVRDAGEDVFLGTINAVNSVLPVCAPQTYQTVQTDPSIGTTPTRCHYTPPGEISQCCHKPFCAPWDLHCVIPIGSTSKDGYCGYISTHNTCEGGPDPSAKCNPPGSNPLLWQFECSDEKDCIFVTGGGIRKEINRTRCHFPPEGDPLHIKGFYNDDSDACICDDIPNKVVIMRNEAPPIQFDPSQPFTPEAGVSLGDWNGAVSSCNDDVKPPGYGVSEQEAESGLPQFGQTACDGPKPTSGFPYCSKTTQEGAQIQWQNLNYPGTSKPCTFPIGPKFEYCAEVPVIQCKHGDYETSSGCASKQPQNVTAYFCKGSNKLCETAQVPSDQPLPANMYPSMGECVLSTACMGSASAGIASCDDDHGYNVCGSGLGTATCPHDGDAHCSFSNNCLSDWAKMKTSPLWSGNCHVNFWSGCHCDDDDCSASCELASGKPGDTCSDDSDCLTACDAGTCGPYRVSGVGCAKNTQCVSGTCACTDSCACT